MNKVKYSLEIIFIIISISSFVYCGNNAIQKRETTEVIVEGNNYYENILEESTYKEEALEATIDYYNSQDEVEFCEIGSDGDTIIIHDNISEIIYNSDDDTTTVTFIWVNDSGMINSWDFTFYGNLTGVYKADDEIKITLKIKHINLTFEYNGINVHYDFELPEERWPGEENFKADLKINPLPQSSIEKI